MTVETDNSLPAAARLSALAGNLPGSPVTRLFQTDEPRPCAVPGPDVDALWFSEYRKRMGHAAKLCQRCPFIGRCGFNAVASRATHGVWGGVVFPGDHTYKLEEIYKQLLDQFERRRPIELGHAPKPAMPEPAAYRRNVATTAA
ncbi:WhiB family transcriptional regulator [Mycobacterium sp. DSM 3803]|nr:WhiB family transcriptional regulator [Mycobacterium sp. DSM 3803]